MAAMMLSTYKIPPVQSQSPASFGGMTTDGTVGPKHVSVAKPLPAKPDGSTPGVKQIAINVVRRCFRRINGPLLVLLLSLTGALLYLQVTTKSKNTTTNNHVTKANTSTSPTNDVNHRVNHSRPINEPDPYLPVICHTLSPGRLGNHLFEYASILGLARRTGRTFFFYNDELLRETLLHPPSRAHADHMKARCDVALRLDEKKDAGGQFDPLLLDMETGQDYRVEGYLQSWLYFHRVRHDDLRQALAFNDVIVNNASRVLHAIRESRPLTTLVGVHVRRGDLVSAIRQKEGYLTAQPEFFDRAMTYFRERFSGGGGVTFVVLGEDRKWSMDNIRAVNGDVIFPLPSGNPAVDLQVLSSCQHLIRTVGTFGWWAAFKVEGRATVVYLKDFIQKRGYLRHWYSSLATDFLIPGWIPM